MVQLLEQQVNPGLVGVKALTKRYIHSFKFDDLALKSYGGLFVKMLELQGLL